MERGSGLERALGRVGLAAICVLTGLAVVAARRGPGADTGRDAIRSQVVEPEDPGTADSGSPPGGEPVAESAAHLP